MSDLRVVSMREETPDEKQLREWFDAQALASVSNLEEAARLFIGLATTLLGALFGVLTLASNPLPAYLRLEWVRGLGVLTVGCLLCGLLAALWVIMPIAWTMNPAQPASQRAVFEQILGRKSCALRVATCAFGLGILSLGLTLIAALVCTS